MRLLQRWEGLAMSYFVSSFVSEHERMGHDIYLRLMSRSFARHRHFVLLPWSGRVRSIGVPGEGHPCAHQCGEQFASSRHAGRARGDCRGTSLGRLASRHSREQSTAPHRIAEKSIIHPSRPAKLQSAGEEALLIRTS